MRAVTVFAVLLLLAAPLAAQGQGVAPQVQVVDGSCAAGRCRCRGVIDSLGPLTDNGVDWRDLRRGTDCLAADFDGDGRTDVALTGAEGMAAVLLSKPGGPQEIHILDAGGVLELYLPRSVGGPHGEPPSERHGLFVRWVGQFHVVFLWDGSDFSRTALPAWGD